MSIMLLSKIHEMQRYRASRHDDHLDLDGRVPPPPTAVELLAFTPLAAAPVVCAAPLTIAVASPC
jgi:hypothetical protein